MTRPAHLHLSYDGGLYDTRDPEWSRKAPLRADYEKTYQEIENAAEFKACLRAGPYAWPGGYQLYFVMSDGEAMSFEAAADCRREIFEAFLSGPNDHSGWRPIGVEINYEDNDLVCCLTTKRIPAAYGED